MLKITYNHNGTGRGDLACEVGDSVVISDSFSIKDATPLADLPADVLTRHGLKQLFDGWTNALESPPPESYLYLGTVNGSTLWLRLVHERSNVGATIGLASPVEVGVDFRRNGICYSTPDGFSRESIPPIEGTVGEILIGIRRSRAMLIAQEQPEHDPTFIFEHFRGTYGTQLLTAAVIHFRIFEHFRGQSCSRTQLQTALELADRPYCVLLTALKAMDLLIEKEDVLSVTPAAQEHFLHGKEGSIADYVGLAGDAHEVLGMVERLKSNQPYGLETDDNGAAFIYRDGIRSAMEQKELARHFTMSLAGRAKNVAPVLADRYRLDDAHLLLDVGGGSGIYAIAYLARNHNLRAIVMDRPEVLTVAEEFAIEYGVEDRLELRSGDMFSDPFPPADVVLLSNILHDWDVPECQQLVQKGANALPPGGRLLIHDVFLNDDHSGPLPIALYSAALFTLTEGRAYSVREYRNWMNAAGLTVTGPVNTLIHCGVMIGTKG